MLCTSREAYAAPRQNGPFFHQREALLTPPSDIFRLRVSVTDSSSALKGRSCKGGIRLRKDGRPDRRTLPVHQAMLKRAQAKSQELARQRRENGGPSDAEKRLAEQREELEAIASLDREELLAQVSLKGGAVDFRRWCRLAVSSVAVRTMLLAAAEGSPEVALKLAAHGFGTAPKMVEVRKTTEERRTVVYRVELSTGEVVSPGVAGLPDAGLVIDCEGRSDDQCSAVGQDVHG